MKSFSESFSAIDQAMLKDRFHLRRQLKKIQAMEQPSDAFSEWNRRLQESIALHETRKGKNLDIQYPEELPVSEKRQQIQDTIRDNQIVILAGETGSGKTTQLPKICLELGRGRSAMIGHTQPRRVAASSVSARIAEELAVQAGQEVAYQVRFADHSNEHTLLKVMTDGVLLAEIPRDRFLEKYDTIIIDEAHERSLNIDFLIGYLKEILPRRKDLKVIITSATIDVERFSKHFNDAPVITVSGRSYPVDIIYHPIEEISDSGNIEVPEAILATVEHIEQIEKSSSGKNSMGDVLVFLPGESDIRQASRLLRKSGLMALEVLPLYARLSSSEHRKIFNPPGKRAGRRIVLATNVAETSLTVPGIRYVIDSGLARVSRYSHRSKVQRLPIEKISQASANQRAGRCGRIAEGICYRLYSEDDFNTREAFTQPEIQRTNLSAVILQMQIMRLGSIENFPFLEPPDRRLINDGFKQLVEIKALDEKKRLTPLGKKLARLPIDPKFARMLIEANNQACLHEILVIVSALSIQDPRESPAEKRDAARQKHSRFKHESSDFMGLLNLWAYVEEQRQLLSNNQFRKLCQKEFLSFQRLKEWRDTHRQLMRICRELKFKVNNEAADYTSIHRSLLTGLLLNVGFQNEKKLFDGTRNRQFRVFPGSDLYKKPPKWLMAGELIETSQLYAHHVAKIDPVWIANEAAHLLKYSYSEPFWSANQGQVMAYRKSSFYGLVISEKQTVSYGKIDPVVSREIFIRTALVEENLKTDAEFFKHNARLRKKILEMEEKSRRRDILVNDDRIFTFYNSRIPEHIVDSATFEKWRKQQEKIDKKLLFADQSVYQAASFDNSEGMQFPDRLEWEGVNYRLSYRFEPGHEDDGISVKIPVAALNRVPRFRFDWLVPGVLPEKCEAMLKSLPKQYRRPLVPVPDTVKELLPLLKASDVSLESELAKAIDKILNVKIPIDAWQQEKIDDYYRMNYLLIDEHGKIIDKGRDLARLIQKHGHKVQKALDKKLSNATEKKCYGKWEFEDLQQEQTFKQGGAVIHAYPAIQDEGDGVSITLTDYQHVQQTVQRNGLIRLAMLALPQQLKYLRQNLLKGNDLHLKLSAGYDINQLRDDLVKTAFNHTFFAVELPFGKKEFMATIDANRAKLTSTSQALEKLLIELVDHDYVIRQRLSGLDQKHFADIRRDIEKQRSELVYPGFMFLTPLEQVFELPRYFHSLAIRLDKLQGQLQKDIRYTAELAELQSRMEALIEETPEAKTLPALQVYRWMIEEYRVSLFSQQLKTRIPISKKRLLKQWDSVIEEKRAARLN